MLYGKFIYKSLINLFLEILCSATVPILIGMARSIVRSTNDDTFLIAKIFPSENLVHAPVSVQDDLPKEKTFSSFRPILPRTLSSHVLNLDSSPSSPTMHQSFEALCSRSRERSPSPMLPRREEKKEDDIIDDTVHYFNKVGSNFTRTKPWGFEIIPENPEEEHLKFSSTNIQKLVSVVSKNLCVYNIQIDFVVEFSVI